MNITKSIIFADLHKWPEYKNSFMNLDDAAKVDCLALRWSMTEFCYKPLGITPNRISNFTSCKRDIHHIMVANTFNCFTGYISEYSYIEMCKTFSKPGIHQIHFIEPNKTSVYSTSHKYLREIIEKCANRHLAHNNRLKILSPNCLVYKPDNVNFLSYLYELVTEWPAEFCKDLMSVLQDIDLSACKNLSFLIYIQRLIAIYNNFLKLKISFRIDDKKCQPKCYGPNNVLKKHFVEGSELRICAVCYTITNLYISKSFNRTNIYSDMLLKDVIYTCPEKTCKFIPIKLIYVDVFDRVLYPEITYVVNKSSVYKIRIDTSSRISNSIIISQYDKNNKNIKRHQSASTISYRDYNTCLDFEIRDFELCDGCKILEKKRNVLKKNCY